MFRNRTIRRGLGAGLSTLAVVGAILAVPAAPAQAGLPSGVGPSISTVAFSSAGTTDCLGLFAANNAGGIYWITQCGNNIHDANGWSSWGNLKGGRAKSTAKYVSSVHSANGDITLAVHGTDDHYWILQSDSGGAFNNGWMQLPAIPGGTCGSCTPMITNNGNDMPEVFAEGSGQLYHTWQNPNGTWLGSWAVMPGSAGDPGSTDPVTTTAEAIGGGAMFVAAQFNGTMKYTFENSANTAWNAWTSLGTGYDYPNAKDTVNQGGSALDFSATNSSDGVFNRHWTGSGWTAWSRVTNGTTHSGNRHIAVSSFCHGSYTIGVVGTDQALYVNSVTGVAGSTFGNWTRIAGTDNAGGFLSFGDFLGEQGLFWIDSSSHAFYSYITDDCSPQWSTPAQLTGLPTT
jgi:hypothetical protein